MTFVLRNNLKSRQSGISGEQIRIEGVGHDLRRAYKVSEKISDFRFMAVRSAIARALDEHDKLMDEMYGG